MKITRKTLTLALCLTPGIGSKTLLRIFTKNDLYNRTPEEFFNYSSQVLEEEYGLPKKTSQKWNELKTKKLEEAHAFELQLDALKIQFTTISDASYPHQILEFDEDPPTVFYLYGNSSLLNKDNFTVLSSRNSNYDTLNQIQKYTTDYIHRGKILVCGHNTPEYQAAAVISLRYASPRILVLDRGLFTALGENLDQELFDVARIWRYEFDPHVDLVISPYHPSVPYIRGANVIRDRVIAGLAQLLLIGEMRIGGNIDAITQKAKLCHKEINFLQNYPL